MEKPKILEAEFNLVLQTYMYLMVSGWLIISVAGIILLPFWLIFGKIYCRHYYKHLECYLTEKTMVLKKGYWYRIEKTIPLDKIQDLTLREGPVLRKLGICMLEIETAGQSNPQGTSDAKIVGIKEAKDFRDKVLAQRDKLQENKSSSHISGTVPDDNKVTSLLSEIRDSLKNIETNIQKNN